MIDILMRIETHKGEERLFAQTAYHKELHFILRSVPGSRWSQTKKQWHFSLSKAVIELIKKETKAIAVLNLSILREQLQCRKDEKAKAKYLNILPETTAAIVEFEKWMVQKRYSPQTVKNYINQVITYFSYYHLKSHRELTADDVTHYKL